MIPSSLGQASAGRKKGPLRSWVTLTCEGPVSGVKNLVVIAFGLALIAFGFMSLAAGSLTLAPVLLVAGYCVVIPVGIMLGVKRKSRPPEDSGETRANSSAG